MRITRIFLSLVLLEPPLIGVQGRLGGAANAAIDELDLQAGGNTATTVAAASSSPNPFHRKLGLDNCSNHGNGNSAVNENTWYVLKHRDSGKFAKTLDTGSDFEVQLDTKPTANIAEESYLLDWPDEFVWRIQNSNDNDKEIKVVNKATKENGDALKLDHDGTAVNSGDIAKATKSGRGFFLKTKSGCEDYKLVVKKILDDNKTFSLKQAGNGVNLKFTQGYEGGDKFEFIEVKTVNHCSKHADGSSIVLEEKWYVLQNINTDLFITISDNPNSNMLVGIYAPPEHIGQDASSTHVSEWPDRYVWQVLYDQSTSNKIQIVNRQYFSGTGANRIINFKDADTPNSSMVDGVEAYAYGSSQSQMNVNLLSEYTCDGNNRYKIHTISSDNGKSYTLKQVGTGDDAFAWEQSYEDGDEFRLVELQDFELVP